MQAKNYNAIDLFRLLFAICVVAIHTNPQLPLGLVGNYVYQGLLGIAVPFFFLTSGFFLFSKVCYKAEGEKEEIKYIKKMFQRYLIWSVIYLPLAVYEYVNWNTGFIRGTILYIKDFILVGGHYYSGHFWYILSSIYAVILIVFLKRRGYTEKKFIVLAFITFAVHCGIDYAASGKYIYEGIGNFIRMTIKDGTLLTGFYYFVSSMFIVKYADKISSKVLWGIFIPIMLLLSAIRLNISGLFWSGILLLISSGILFIGISRIRLPDAKIWIRLRHTSSIIFFSHRLFIFMYRAICADKWYYSENGCFIFTVCGTCILTCILIICYEKQFNSKLIKLLL